MTSIPWTKESVELLRKLVEERYSASQIARQIGHGLTRNAVCSKMNRLGLSSRHRARNYPPIEGPVIMLPLEPPAVAARKENGKLYGLYDLDTGMCKWPIGDPQKPDFHWCANPAKNVYCGYHSSIAGTRYSGPIGVALGGGGQSGVWK